MFIFQALDGFIAVITQDGQLFYVSENVRDFLGYSQVSENCHTILIICLSSIRVFEFIQ